MEARYRAPLSHVKGAWRPIARFELSLEPAPAPATPGSAAAAGMVALGGGGGPGAGLVLDPWQAVAGAARPPAAGMKPTRCAAAWFGS